MRQHKFFVTILILSLSGLLFLSGLTVVASAQEPAPFEISVIPQADQATAGEPFTYTVTITNSSQTIQEDITVVNIPLPEGTTFLRTKTTDIDWAVMRPEPGEPGVVRWLTVEPVNPGDVFSFTLIVQTSIEATGDKDALIQDNYGVALKGPDNVIVAGPSIRTAIVSPTPSPTPTEGPPSPTPTPTKATGVSSATQPAATATATRQPVATSTEASTVPEPVVNNNDTTDSTLPLPPFILVLLLISISIIAVLWFFRRK